MSVGGSATDRRAFEPGARRLPDWTRSRQLDARVHGRVCCRSASDDSVHCFIAITAADRRPVVSGPLWTPSPEDVARANLTRFIVGVECPSARRRTTIRASTRGRSSGRRAFWSAVWDFCGIVADRDAEDRVAIGAHGRRADGASRSNAWSPMVRRCATELRRESACAFVTITLRSIAWNELGAQRRLTFAELYAEVPHRFGRAAGAGSARAAIASPRFMPNIPETIIAMLATASIGAIWSSCSPDFGVQGVLDRFGQIEPRILFCADGYRYCRKRDRLASARSPESRNGSRRSSTLWSFPTGRDA